MSRGHVLLAVVATLAIASLVSSCRPAEPLALRDEGADLLLDNPYKEENHAAVLEYLDTNTVKPQFGGKVFSAYHIMGSSSNRIYAWAVCREYSKGANEDLDAGTGVSGPVVLSVEIRDGLLCVTGRKCPRDGALYTRDVKSLFPPEVQDQIFGIQQGDTVRELQKRCESRAREQLGVAPPPPEWRFLVDESDPKPEFAALLEAGVNWSPEVDPVSPDAKFLLADDDGLTALPLFPGGSPVSLCRAAPASDGWLYSRPVGWLSETECLFVTFGVQNDGPHEGFRGVALLAGSVLDGHTTEIAYFDLPQGYVKAATWDITTQKVYLHAAQAIWEIDIAGRAARKLRGDLPSNDGLFQAIPSPDGTKFAYHTPLPGKTALTVLDNRTGKETAIHADGDARSFYPLWSPDSRYLVAYFAGRKPADSTRTPGQFDVLPDEDGPFAAAKGLIVYDTLTGLASVLQVEGKWLLSPIWSPDSSTLHFMSGSILLDPAPPMLDAKRVEYDSLWVMTPVSNLPPQKVADLAFVPVGEPHQRVSANPVAAMPGGRGVLLQVIGSEPGGPRLWNVSCGADPVRMAMAGLDGVQARRHPPDGSIAAVARAEQGSEIWLFGPGEGGIAATKVADLGRVDSADIVAYAGDSVLVVLRDNEANVSALAVYRVP